LSVALDKMYCIGYEPNYSPVTQQQTDTSDSLTDGHTRLTRPSSFSEAEHLLCQETAATAAASSDTQQQKQFMGLAGAAEGNQMVPQEMYTSLSNCKHK